LKYSDQKYNANQLQVLVVLLSWDIGLIYSIVPKPSGPICEISYSHYQIDRIRKIGYCIVTGGRDGTQCGDIANEQRYLVVRGEMLGKKRVQGWW
jgi:hypothetical protein